MTIRLFAGRNKSPPVEVIDGFVEADPMFDCWLLALGLAIRTDMEKGDNL